MYHSPLHLYKKNMKNIVLGLLQEDNSTRIQEDNSTGSGEETYDIWSNMMDINVWMGANDVDYTPPNTADTTPPPPLPTAVVSKLHVDSYDNLYVLVEGHKQFLLISPQHAAMLETVFPTYTIGKRC